MTDIRSIFKGRLLRAAGRSKKPNKQIAEEVGINEKTLYSYFYGSFPKLSTFYHICEVLNVSADYLLGRTEFMEVDR